MTDERAANIVGEYLVAEVGPGDHSIIEIKICMARVCKRFGLDQSAITIGLNSDGFIDLDFSESGSLRSLAARIVKSRHRALH